MGKKYVELKTTDNTTIFVRKESVDVLEDSPASSRVEGHVKLFVAGFKFAIKGTAKEVMALLDQP
ncbi:MAG: hypothetical protein IT288_01990 [Bdellovibrionales bacterium]|nr:hypothetical protein [Bdellovibrionales bacterium]